MIEEALKAVEKLNREIPDSFELHTDGYSIVIMFISNFQLWCSDDDEREFNENKNEYEPLEGYLRKEVQKAINQIGKLKLKND